MQADGSNLHLLYQPVAEYALSLAWSPDGKRFAFGNFPGIAVVNSDGTGFRQLTGPSKIQTPDDLPAWSPDSKSIAFEHSVLTSKDSGADVQIWLMTADGRNQHPLIAELAHDLGNPTWSPDGRQLAYFRWGDSRQGLESIEVVSSSGTGAHSLTQPTRNFTRGPAWSPVR
jgi:Tol biopolymer transport system component